MKLHVGSEKKKNKTTWGCHTEMSRFKIDEYGWGVSQFLFRVHHQELFWNKTWQKT